MFTTGVPRGESPHRYSGMSTDTGHPQVLSAVLIRCQAEP